MKSPDYFQEVEKSVEHILEKVGKDIVMGIPLALGKPNQLTNEMYRRAKEDSSIKLKIVTALTLEKPNWSSELERRFLQPFIERIFGDYCELEYAKDLRKGTLPLNIEIMEFFTKPGGFLNVPQIQQSYISCNYTHAARDSVANGVNVAAQMVSKAEVDGQLKYSMSCNPEVSADIIPLLREQEKNGKKIAIVGQVNQNLPFMYGDAMVDADGFDVMIDNKAYYSTLFGAPKMSVTTQDYMIGLNASTLIKDGGTLQIGIGSLGDALCYGLQMRNVNNDQYKAVVEQTGLNDKFGNLIDRVGSRDVFDEGLYGSTEMLVDGYLHLINSGVIKRKSYDNVHLQKLKNEGKIVDAIKPDILEKLIESNAISAKVTEKNFDFLKEYGVFKDGVTFDNGIIKSNGDEISADLGDSSNMIKVVETCLGDELKKGVLIHAGFFLGPQSFYSMLSDMPEEERQKIYMTSVLNVNQLYGGEELKVLQRKKARFVNATIMVTMSGAVCSDGLENGQVVSGVGGQYNFVAMAHALRDARSILMAKSTRTKGKDVSSNIVWSYGHLTIPRHLRDVIITEYGIADIRGKSDKGIIAELLNITDSRFQDELLQLAKSRGKLPLSYVIPDKFKNNSPERLEDDVSSFKKDGFFPPFPLGCDFTSEELVIGKSLKTLKAKMTEGMSKVSSIGRAMTIMSVPENAMPYLERMGLEAPENSKEKMMQKLVIHALSLSGAI